MFPARNQPDPWEQAAAEYTEWTGRKLCPEGPAFTHRPLVLAPNGEFPGMTIVGGRHYQSADGGRVSFVITDKGEVSLGAD